MTAGATPDPSRHAAGLVAEVALPVAVDHPYSYLIPPGLALAPGDCVRVPLGTRETFGVVWQLAEGRSDNLKPVIGKNRLPPLSESMRRFIQRVADYTLAPIGMVARMALRDPDRRRMRSRASPCVRPGRCPNGSRQPAPA